MKYLDYLVAGLEKLCAVLMLIMTIVTFAQAINRYVFSGAFFWAEEAAILSMIWIAFLGSVVAARKGMNIRIDFFTRLLPPKGQRILEGVNCMLCAVFLAMLSIHSLPIIKNTMFINTPGMKVSRSVYYFAVLVGGALMVLYYVILAVCHWAGYELDRREKAS